MQLLDLLQIPNVQCSTFMHFDIGDFVSLMQCTHLFKKIVESASPDIYEGLHQKYEIYSIVDHNFGNIKKILISFKRLYLYFIDNHEEKLTLQKNRSFPTATEYSLMADFVDGKAYKTIPTKKELQHTLLARSELFIEPNAWLKQAKIQIKQGDYALASKYLIDCLLKSQEHLTKFIRLRVFLIIFKNEYKNLSALDLVRDYALDMVIKQKNNLTSDTKYILNESIGPDNMDPCYVSWVMRRVYIAEIYKITKYFSQESHEKQQKIVGVVKKCLYSDYLTFDPEALYIKGMIAHFNFLRGVVVLHQPFDDSLFLDVWQSPNTTTSPESRNKNLETAYNYFAEAATRGHATAMMALALYHYQSQEFSKAKNWFEHALQRYREELPDEVYNKWSEEVRTAFYYIAVINAKKKPESTFSHASLP